MPEETPASSTSSLHSLSHVLSGGVLKQKMRAVRKKRRSLQKQRHFIRVAIDQEGSIILSPAPSLSRSSHPSPLGRLKSGSPLLQALKRPLLELPGETLGNTLRVGLHSVQVTTELPLPRPQKAAATAAGGGGLLLSRTHSAPLPLRMASPRPGPSPRPAITPLLASAGPEAGGLWPSSAAAAAGTMGFIGISDDRPRLATSSSCSLDVSICHWRPVPGHVLGGASPVCPQVADKAAAGPPAAAVEVPAPLLAADWELDDVSWEACADGIVLPSPPPAAAVAALPPLGSVRAISTGFPGAGPGAASAYPQQQQVRTGTDKISAELASLDSMLFEAACGAALPEEVQIPPLDHSALQWGESVADVRIDDLTETPSPAAAEAVQDERLGGSLAVGAAARAEFGAVSSVSAGTAVAAGVSGDCQLQSCASAGLLPVEVAAPAAASPAQHLSPEWPGGMLAAAGRVEGQPARTFTTHGPNGVVISSEGPICGQQGAPGGSEGYMLLPSHPGSSSDGRVWGPDRWKGAPLELNGSGSSKLPPKYKAKTKSVSRQLELSAEPRSCAFAAAPPFQMLGGAPTGSSSRPYIHGLGSEPIPQPISSSNGTSHDIVCSSGATILGSNVPACAAPFFGDAGASLHQPHQAMPASLSVCASGPIHCGLPPGASHGMGNVPTYGLPVPAAANTARSPFLHHAPVRDSSADVTAQGPVNHGIYMAQQQQQYAHQQHNQQQHGAMRSSASAVVQNSSTWSSSGGAASQSHWWQQAAPMAPLQGEQQQMLGAASPHGDGAKPEQKLQLPVISTSVPLPQAQQQQQGAHLAAYQGGGHVDWGSGSFKGGASGDFYG